MRTEFMAETLRREDNALFTAVYLGKMSALECTTL
jgi:hypothetical protein